MPSGITSTDHMMSVREVPWHGIGTILDHPATAREAIVAAKLGWTVSKEPLYYHAPNRRVATVDRHYVTVRSDTGAALGVVGEHYTPLQNSDAFGFMDRVCMDPNGPIYHTAGSLRGGARVWMLAKLPTFIEVINAEDRVDEYLLLSNSHDGSSQVHILWTPIRVVCNNTLTAALRGSGQRFKARHTFAITSQVSDARAILGIAQENHEWFSALTKRLSSASPTPREVNQVLNKLFAKGENDTAKQAPSAAIGIATVKTLFEDGEANNLDGMRRTAWSLYNAITEYADHDKAIRPMAGRTAAAERVFSNWFGSSAKLKSDALDAVADLVK